jgi:hypothetical protein
MAFRARDPGAPIGVNEREIGRRQFERLIAAVGNEVPLGGLDNPVLVNPHASGPPPRQPAAVNAAASTTGLRLPSGRRALAIAGIGLLVLVAGMSILSTGPSIDEGDGITVEPTEFVDEPVTPEPEVTEPPETLPAEGSLGPETTTPVADLPAPEGIIRQVYVRGDVPPAAETARLGVRAGLAEEPGPVDLTVYRLGYSEGAPAEIREIWDRLFASDGDWSSDGDVTVLVTNSDQGDGLMVRVVAEPGSSGGFTAPLFGANPGQPFGAWVELRVAPVTTGAATFVIDFFDATGTTVDEQVVALEPVD